MKNTFKLFAFLISGLMVIFTSCNNSGGEENTSVVDDSEPIKVVDKANVPFLPDDAFEDTINGVHVSMAYIADGKYFKGSLENVTEELVTGVKVNVYLSNGFELLNPLPTDLKVDAYETSVIIDADVKEWDTWGIEIDFVTDELVE